MLIKQLLNETNSFQNAFKAWVSDRVRKAARGVMARVAGDAPAAGRARLLHFLGPRNQHPVWLPETVGRRFFTGYGRQSGGSAMVGLHGRHHGGQSGQFTRFNPSERGLLYGVMLWGENSYLIQKQAKYYDHMNVISVT